jgi:serine protease inhibitor
MLEGALGALAMAGLSSLSACASSPNASRSPGLRPLTSGLPREGVSLSAVANLAPVLLGMRNLSASLHRVSATVAENWTVSPLSLAVAFGMLRAGCRGSAAREVDKVFGFPAVTNPEGSPHAALNALTAQLVTSRPVGTATSRTPSGRIAPDPIIAIANGLFLDRTFAPEVHREFLQTLGRQYGSSPTAVSFADPAAAAAINAWVARETRDRIKRLFDNLDPSTVLVLANAVYLKAAWLNQFDDAATITAPFTDPTGSQLAARMMRQQFESVPYAAGDGWQRVSLPYVGDQLSMRVVVPTRVATSVAALRVALAAAAEPSLTDGRSWVDLTLPSWNAETALPLVPALSSLGMSEVFQDGADLSGIAAGLHVSDAIHRANITVDERGTEAAAVTGIAIATAGHAGAPIMMRADRPFAWAVVHEPTGTPIFTGHVTKPVAPR